MVNKIIVYMNCSCCDQKGLKCRHNVRSVPRLFLFKSKLDFPFFFDFFLYFLRKITNFVVKTDLVRDLQFIEINCRINKISEL